MGGQHQRHHGHFHGMRSGDHQDDHLRGEVPHRHRPRGRSSRHAHHRGLAHSSGEVNKVAIKKISIIFINLKIGAISNVEQFVQVEFDEGIQLHERYLQPNHLEEIRRAHAEVRVRIPEQARHVVSRVHLPHEQDRTRSLRHAVPHDTRRHLGRVPLLHRAATDVSSSTPTL